MVQDEYKPYFDLWSMAIDYNGSRPQRLESRWDISTISRDPPTRTLRHRVFNNLGKLDMILFLCVQDFQAPKRDERGVSIRHAPKSGPQ